MKPSEIFRENAENCAQLAVSEATENGPAYRRYKRMEAAWRALAERARMAGRGSTTRQDSRVERTEKAAQVSG
jgi:hypothetical protein